MLNTIIKNYMSGCDCLMKHMYSPGYTKTVDDEDGVLWRVRFTRKVFIQTIASLEEGEMGILVGSNFPVVDFVIKSLIEDHITVGKTHKCLIIVIQSLLRVQILIFLFV